MTARTFSGRDIEIKLVDPNEVPLFRLTKRPGQEGGEWEPPPSLYRNERVDPPNGHKDAFAMLYTGDQLITVGLECLVLNVNQDGNWTLNKNAEKGYKLCRYAYSNPACFIKIDGDNKRVFGLDQRSNYLDYSDYQQLSLELYNRYGKTVHGLTWQSLHRHGIGNVYAIWHDRKNDIDLSVRSLVNLARCKDWLDMQKKIPSLKKFLR